MYVIRSYIYNSRWWTGDQHHQVRSDRSVRKGKSQQSSAVHPGAYGLPWVLQPGKPHKWPMRLDPLSSYLPDVKMESATAVPTGFVWYPTVCFQKGGWFLYFSGMSWWQSRNTFQVFCGGDSVFYIRLITGWWMLSQLDSGCHWIHY